jgi:hypothetical protein
MPAVAIPKASYPTPEQPHEPRVYSPKYKGVTVDTRYIPSSALLTHVEGSSMSVNWYSQVLNDDTELAGQNPNRNPILQPYLLIEGMELKVTTPLTFAQIENTQNVGATGQANVYPFLVPNDGDMFLTDVGDGREGIFKVTNTTRKSIFKDTCYEIEYEFVDFSDRNLFRIADLNTKVVETYVFMKDFLQYGQNPVLLKEEANMVLDLTFAHQDITRQWFQEFFSREFSTLAVPGQAFATYDSFITTFMMKFVTTLAAPEVQYTRLLNTDGPMDLKTPTIWDVCRERNPMLMRMINRQMGLTAALYFPSNPMMEGIHHSGFQYIVYPKNPRQSWDDKRNMYQPLMLAYSLTPVPSIAGRLEELITAADLKGMPYENCPLLKDILCDDYYIFSQAFYDQDRPNMSKLEQAVWDMIERKPVSLKLLNFFTKTYQTWGGLERFYFTPFVLMLIRSQIRSL